MTCVSSQTIGQSAERVRERHAVVAQHVTAAFGPQPSRNLHLSSIHTHFLSTQADTTRQARDHCLRSRGDAPGLRCFRALPGFSKSSTRRESGKPEARTMFSVLRLPESENSNRQQAPRQPGLLRSAIEAPENGTAKPPFDRAIPSFRRAKRGDLSDSRRVRQTQCRRSNQVSERAFVSRVPVELPLPRSHSLNEYRPLCPPGHAEAERSRQRPCGKLRRTPRAPTRSRRDFP